MEVRNQMTQTKPSVPSFASSSENGRRFSGGGSWEVKGAAMDLGQVIEEQGWETERPLHTWRNEHTHTDTHTHTREINVSLFPPSSTS